MTIRHGRNVSIYVNGVDISGDLNSINPVSEQELADISAFGNIGHTLYPGLAKDSGTIEALYNSTEATVFQNLLQTDPGYDMMIPFGTSLGDPSYACQSVKLKNNGMKSVVTDVNRASISFEVDNYPFEKGYMLTAGKQTVAAASTGQGSTVTTGGGAGTGATYLQIFQVNSTSGTLTVSVQTSSTGAWAGEQITTATFAAASTIGTQRVSIGLGLGLASNYVRAAWVNAGSTASFALAIVKYQ